MPSGRALRDAVLPAAAIGLLTWLVLGGALLGIAYDLDGHQRQLFEHLRVSRMTTGTLIGKDTGDHDSFTYSYDDRSGRRHEGGDSGEGQEQGDPADLHVGAEITIWYSVRHPSISCYCTPSQNPPAGLVGPELAISQFLAVPVGVLTGVTTYRRRAGLPVLRLGRAAAGPLNDR